jgi:hypothetical protein
MDAAGLASQQRLRYLALRDRVGNLELLLQQENAEKSNQDFETWIHTRDPSFRRRHLIPGDDDLLRFDRFEHFVAAREKLIEQRLRGLFGADQT